MLLLLVCLWRHNFTTENNILHFLSVIVIVISWIIRGNLWKVKTGEQLWLRAGWPTCLLGLLFVSACSWAASSGNCFCAKQEGKMLMMTRHETWWGPAFLHHPLFVLSYFKSYQSLHKLSGFNRLAIFVNSDNAGYQIRQSYDVNINVFTLSFQLSR